MRQDVRSERSGPRAALAAGLLATLAWVALVAPAAAREAPGWVPAWTAAPVAAYPAGYTVGQPGPELEGPPGLVAPRLTAAFPDDQASDQTLRMIVRPGIGGRTWRVRLSNQFGTGPVTFGRATVAVRQSGATLVPGTSRPLTFSGRRSVTVARGATVASDPVGIRLREPQLRDLAVSLNVAGASGPMTWHGASFTTSYLTDQGAGDRTADPGEEAFPHPTTSWFFLAGLEVRRRDVATVVALGDSITDGYFSTINGHDRWPDVLRRRLELRGEPALSVINQGITGNMVTRVGRLPGGCTVCDGPPLLDRLERDVLRQPGVRAVILMEGINDLGSGGATAAQVIAGLREVAERVRARGIRIVGATLTPAGGTEFDQYGTPETDARRQEVNAFIRANGGVFDAMVDFAAATEDPADRSRLLPVFDTNTSVGGPGDHLHPNRAGLAAMARAVDVDELRRFARRAAATAR